MDRSRRVSSQENIVAEEQHPGFSKTLITKRPFLRNSALSILILYAIENDCSTSTIYTLLKINVVPTMNT